MNKELAKTLTTALVQFIDREIPEGTMCCSSAECERIESSFKLGDFPSIEQFVKKKLSRLTEFEQEVSDIVEYCKEHGGSVAFDYAKRHAKSLLAFAKKELFKQGEGTYYYSPKNDELIYMDSNAVPGMHTLSPLCYEPGGTCTNPHMDCINCPKTTTGGTFITSSVTATLDGK